MSSYHRSSTEIVAYAWNAAIVCTRCTRMRLISALKLSSSRRVRNLPLSNLGTDELAEIYAQTVLGYEGDDFGELDTNVFPQPCFGDDSDTLNDSCDQCLTRIEDTL